MLGGGSTVGCVFLSATETQGASEDEAKRVSSVYRPIHSKGAMIVDAIKVGRRIMTLRKEHGYTQEYLAELLDISPQAVSKWEHGRALPDTPLLPALAKALETSVDAILTDSRLRILSAHYGDGLENHAVANRLNRLIDGDKLELDIGASALACPAIGDRPAYLIVKAQADERVFYAFAAEGTRLLLDLTTPGQAATAQAEIIAAAYGTAKAAADVLHKIAHYQVFNWRAYHADHEIFPSHPANDAPEYLTFVYLNAQGIHMVTCEEGESIAYSEDNAQLVRQRTTGEHFLERVPALPAFGKGWECSWAAALTAALQTMGIETTYEHVMGVSGACYRLAFCSPGWDYSAVDALVAYDYATPGYKAFGYAPRFGNRIEKENRAPERKAIVTQLRSGMPVLGINLRVAPEWGVICGYRENGAQLFCRTKYDARVVDEPDFERGKLNAYDYLPVENWPFIITYFGDRITRPTDADNLSASLRVLVESARKTENRGYAMGIEAYRVWIGDLRDEAWYNANDDEQVARRLSVNQFCALALWDARRAAHAYLSQSRALLPGKQTELAQLAAWFGDISKKAGEVHAMLDSGEYLEGEKARRFWTPPMRERQAALLEEMQALEAQAAALAER